MFRFVFSVALNVVRAGVGAAIMVLTTLTLLALFGFVWPLADALNHFQPIWFGGLLVSCVLAYLSIPSRSGRVPFVALGFVGLAASAVPLGKEFLAQATYQPSTITSEIPLRVMSHNLFGMNYDMARVAAQIDAEQPDVLAFQEYFIEQSSRLHPMIAEQYPYSFTCTGGRRAAIAIYSRSPFTLSDQSVCPSNVGRFDGAVARLIAEFPATEHQGAWSLVTTHLNWPVRVSVLRRSELDWNEKLTAMTARKIGEMRDLAEALNGLESPAVLVGDLNATPWSYSLRDLVTASETQRHTLNLPSYPNRLSIRGWRDTVPFLPLDHFLTKAGVQVHAIRTGDPAGSDHLPLIADISIPR